MKALLVVDIQKGYIERYDGGLLARINRRIQRAADNEELIIYIKNSRSLKSGVKTYELAENLSVRSPHILSKKTASAFSCVELLEILAQNQVSEIEIVGIDGCCCIAASAEDAARRGYSVVLPLEFIGVQNPGRFAKKKLSLAEKGVIII